jgi:uncharacterized protein (DUF2342 family)
MAQTKAAEWVTLTENDHNTTSACAAGYGALVKSQSFERKHMDGMNITVQVGESMVYVPNVMLEQNDNGWVLTPHFPK